MFTYQIGKEIAKNLDGAMKIAAKTLAQSDLQKIQINVFRDKKEVARFDVIREGKLILFDDCFLRSNLNGLLNDLWQSTRKSKNPTKKSNPAVTARNSVNPVVFERVVQM